MFKIVIVCIHIFNKIHFLVLKSISFRQLISLSSAQVRLKKKMVVLSVHCFLTSDNHARHGLK